MLATLAVSVISNMIRLGSTLSRCRWLSTKSGMPGSAKARPERFTARPVSPGCKASSSIARLILPGRLHRGDEDARRDDADRLLGVETQQRLEVIDLAGVHLAYRLFI